MTPWSDLLPEILNNIAGKFEFYEDIINFRCVCTSWKSSVTTTKNTVHCLPSRFPILMFSESTTEEDEHDCHRLFLLSNGGTMRKLPLPEACQQRCLSTHGWLLTTGEQEFYTKLIHPLSRTQIDLPQLYMFEELYFDQDEWMYYMQSMRKVVFTSSNPLKSDPSFRVIIIWGIIIGFCNPGDKSWTRIISGWEGHLLDMIYHKKRERLYVVATMGSIYECGILNNVSSPRSLSRVATFPGKEFGCSSLPCSYLLEWGYDSLLLVTRERHYFRKHEDEYGLYGPYRTNAFQCFMLNLNDGKWLEPKSLGNKAVFLGFNSSFAIDVGGNVKPDCIYFTDDLYEPYRDLPDGGGGDVGVYHMSDGRMEAILFGSQELVFHGSPPLWLQTSTQPAIKIM